MFYSDVVTGLAGVFFSLDREPKKRTWNRNGRRMKDTENAGRVDSLWEFTFITRAVESAFFCTHWRSSALWKCRSKKDSLPNTCKLDSYSLFARKPRVKMQENVSLFIFSNSYNDLLHSVAILEL